TVFRQLGIFSGGFSLEAAETVCRVDTAGRQSEVGRCGPATTSSSAVHAPPDLLQILESLIVKNLIRRDRADEPRFTILETIREYALEQLDANGELQAIRDRSAAFFLEFAEDATRNLTGRDQLACLRRIDAEIDN